MQCAIREQPECASCTADNRAYELALRAHRGMEIAVLQGGECQKKYRATRWRVSKKIPCYKVASVTALWFVWRRVPASDDHEQSARHTHVPCESAYTCVVGSECICMFRMCACCSPGTRETHSSSSSLVSWPRDERCVDAMARGRALGTVTAQQHAV